MIWAFLIYILEQIKNEILTISNLKEIKNRPQVQNWIKPIRNFDSISKSPNKNQKRGMTK